MLRFGETNVAKVEFYGAKKANKFCYVNVDNTIVSKLIKTKTNSKYLIGYSDEVRQPLVLICLK